MDECVCDFMSAYYKIEPSVDTPKKFHTMVMEHKIFTNLGWMSNGIRLVNALENMEHTVNVEMLTSMGTWTDVVAEEGKRQKLEWLAKKGIRWPANFVNTWADKHKYANPHSLLIDDRHDTCRSFREAGGIAVEYADENFEEMWNDIENKIWQIQRKINEDEIKNEKLA